jgi:hypothetical protein
MLIEIKTKKLLQSRITALRTAIQKSRVFLPRNLSKFVFLCGANKASGEISERRKALIEFSKAQLPHTQFFIAERMFSTLLEEGHKGNILDVEHLISDFSDRIVIVLESPSAFTELGAFSLDKLRKKLVVINDENFRNSLSFINLGPIRAIEEAAGPESILYYKMGKDGVMTRDGIGGVFFKLHQMLKDPLRTTARAINLDSLNPSKNFDKYAAMFIHDLIYMTGPLIHKELIALLVHIFGDIAFNKVVHLLAILTSFESIERNKSGFYRSKLKTTYLEYRYDNYELISTFRNYILKSYPERLYEN